MSSKEYGVFLPIGNGGWLISDTAPHPQATYEENKNIATLAEDCGMDFAMAMAKWRGFGGTTDHWGRTLESITMMAGIAEATSSINIWATVHANLQNPAIAAKMFTTLEHIAPGRVGMNIVSGSYAAEFEQMGMWDAEMTKDERYRMVDEWITAIKLLWADGRVDMDGEFFSLDDCESRPQPTSAPTLISAGRSEPGRAFQAKHCDGAFLSGDTLEDLRDLSRDVHERAAANDRECKTYAMLTVVMDETDAIAEQRAEAYGEGVDREALTNMAMSWGMPRDRALNWTQDAKGQAAFQTPFVAGSRDTVVEKIDALVETAELDGLMLIFPDYERELPIFGAEALPLLKNQDVSA
ncbi:LLM class flavin-dependent oxidoreductase [Demequina sediminicola]|uniref:LLM class flavin-dependent oxidoreductase n=1 Tax=Demequina sediminicola TaxID=1095026 RepID=UPI000781B1A3|nr:LLM class flavin-dependent oxidoreductase [Demequina sediminicola]